jgi:hypothetical protein
MHTRSGKAQEGQEESRLRNGNVEESEDKEGMTWTEMGHSTQSTPPKNKDTLNACLSRPHGEFPNTRLFHSNKTVLLKPPDPQDEAQG